MSIDTNAIMPESGVFESFKKLTERPEIKKSTTRQQKIASLANSTAFKALQEVIDGWIENLQDIPVDPNKDDVTSVGFRYLASKVTREYLTDIRNLPERYRNELKEDEIADNE